jgi:hypothetical protein
MQKGGSGPIDLNAAMRILQTGGGAEKSFNTQVGRTNQAIQQGINDNNLGNVNASSGNVPEVAGSPTPGSKSATEKAATGEQAPIEINVSELVDAIADNGKRLDGIASLLGGTLTTETSGEVTVAGLDEFASRVGADVTDLQSIVAQLGTIVDINGLPLNARDDQLQAQIEQAKTDVATDFTNLSDELFIRAEVAGLDAAQQELASLEATLTILKDALDDAVAEGSASSSTIQALGETVAISAQQLSAAEDRLGLAEIEAREAREEGRQAGILAIAASEKAEEIDALKLRQDDIEAAQAEVEAEREDLRDATGQLLAAQDEVSRLTREFNDATSAQQLSDREIATVLNKIQTAEAEVRTLKTVQDQQLIELREAKADLLVTKGKLNATETKADQAIAIANRKKDR